MATDALSGPESVKNAANLFAVLSRRDTLALFLLVKDGLKSELRTASDLGLSKKQYYTRLNQLKDAGLVEKYGDTYVYTTLGDIIHKKYVSGLVERVRFAKQFKMIDALKKAREFSEDDISQFTRNIAGLDIEESSPKIELVWTYEEAASKLAQTIEFAEKEIVFATRFLNEVLINSILNKTKSGVSVRILADRKMVDSFAEMERKYLNLTDEHSSERLNVVRNPWYPKNIERRIADVPFSMSIIDGRYAGLELMGKNNPDKFTGAMFINDRKVCAGLLEFYQKAWDGASEDTSTIARNDDQRAFARNRRSNSLAGY
jgi:sugar-specific transcriptional regulator TrmB